ncbi:oxidoreductase [Steroidobacter denitrificans]|uniref:Oxidoreductase n=1 Tax=Steroidobacter denitrificans TaxID=465721 RepID=A0A127F730_STEDE|nr:TIGR03617 family F420-dependent LLM class oxidoreductase [Steroidobacter denitrificans]AMN46207.1 oxidoreductase [Steroidobacter denitrificans]
MEIFASTPEHCGIEAIGDFARRAERLGYNGIFVADAIHDGLLLACQALAATTRLKVAISVLVAFPRSPMNVALAAWDLQKMSGGRFELGLGSQIRQNIEERYSARWRPPAAGMKDYIGALRAIFRSFRNPREPLNFIGEYYRFTRLQPFFNPGPIEAPDIPIALGAVGPKMLRLAGNVADGLYTHPTNTSPRYLREVILPGVAAGAFDRDAALAPPKISVLQLTAMGPDAGAVAAERQRLRGLLAFLFSTPAYWPSLALFGWQDVGPDLQQLTREGRWQDMAAALPEALLDEFLVCATYEDLPEALAGRFADLACRITLPLPDDVDQDAVLTRVVAAIRARWVAR